MEVLFEVGRMRCCKGSLALIASAKARDISSGAVVWLVGWTVELERDLPGVGIPLVRPGPGIPDCLGLAGVVIAVFKGFQSNERYGKGPDSISPFESSTFECEFKIDHMITRNFNLNMTEFHVVRRSSNSIIK